MRILFLSFLLGFFCFQSFGVEKTAAPDANMSFKLSLTELPKNLDPHRSRSSSGGFLNQQLYRNFYQYDDKNAFTPELGESCLKKALKWTCKLKPNLQWSDGSPLVAEDFVLSYRRILTLPSPRADLLFLIKNAQEVFEQKKKPEDLGVKALDSRTLEITWASLKSPDRELILMSPLFVPLPNGKFKKRISSGPYHLSDQNNQRIRLSPNQLYFKKNNRPPVEFQIFEENLAVKAYETQKLDFLRRVPTGQIPDFENRPDFYWYSVLRLDSIAFGPELKDDFELRKILTESLKYEELQKLFHSPGKIGCPGLSESMASEVCYTGYSDSSPQKKSYKPPEDLKLAFAYSTAGGDDHRRLGEWLQSQWQTHLKISIILKPLENKIFQDLIEKNPPSLFRRGLNLEYPTCHNALKIFTSSHPDNFIHFNNKKYDEAVSKLALGNLRSQKTLCNKALKILMDAYVMIPTGKIHFAIMVNPHWTGWKINSLNHLDLGELALVTP
jgi:oligopeptide transport system substrate-binding protein